MSKLRKITKEKAAVKLYEEYVSKLHTWYQLAMSVFSLSLLLAVAFFGFGLTVGRNVSSYTVALIIIGFVLALAFIGYAQLITRRINKISKELGIADVKKELFGKKARKRGGLGERRVSEAVAVLILMLCGGGGDRVRRDDPGALGEAANWAV